MITIAGIDPGLNGGIAIFHDWKFTITIPMPVSGKVLNTSQVKQMLSNVDLVVMEKVTAMPNQGVVSMFTFGIMYGMMQGIVLTLGIPLRLVTPQAWKKEILVGTAKDKNAAIEYVSRTFPNIQIIPKGKRKPHNGVADAVCIAEYGYRAYA